MCCFHGPSTGNAEAAGGSAPTDRSGPTFVSPFSNKKDDDDDSSYWTLFCAKNHVISS